VDEWSFDLTQRYHQAAEYVDRLCRGTPTPVRLLDVGCNVVNILGRFFDAERVEVVRCDVIDGPADDANYVQLDPDAPLPFEDGSFDAVVSLEVLEHVPRDRRQAFVADLARVARRGVVLCCPAASDAVATGERLVSDAYQLRHGAPHPFLREHAEFGVPSEGEVRALLATLDLPFAVYPGTAIDLWFAATMLSEGLGERASPPKLHAEMARALANRAPAGGPYRLFFVIAKSFDATEALDPSDPARSGGECPLPAVLNHFADAAAAAVMAVAAENAHLPDVLREVIREQDRGLNAQELRFQILRSYADGLTNSAGWRLLAPLRALRHWLRPRGFDHAHLLPWKSLEPVAGRPNTWQVLDTDPQFVVSCWLPAGWLRVRFAGESSIHSRIEFYAERDGAFDTSTLLGQFSIAEGRNDEEFFLKLERPTRALRIDPLDAPGTLRIDRLELTPRPAPYAVVDALRRKLRLLRAYHNTGPVLRRGLALLLTGRWTQVAQKWALGLHDPRCTRHGFYEPQKAYDRWMEKHALTDADRAAQRDWAATAVAPPMISVLMPVYDTPERYLRLAVESVLRQTYPHWELCIADDGSPAPHVRPILEEYARRDPRVKLTPPGRQGGISAATNAALNLATGRFVALFDHDDELAEHALFAMAKASVEQPDADVLYSDEDKIQPDGRRVTPFFKPDWSPEFFLGCMYTCHLSLYRTDLVRQVGGFRPTFDGAQDYDLALRVIEQSRRVVHVPDVLYHWRLLPNSTASGVAAKPHAHAAGLRALEDHLRRTGRQGRAELGPSAGLNFVRFAIRGTPSVTIIIPSLCKPDRAPHRSQSLIENCVGSIQRLSTWRNVEIIILDGHTMSPAMERRLVRGNVRRITYDDAFNWSRVNNLAAEEAAGDYLLFLNDDTEVTTPGWIEALLEFAQQPEVGAVGARLLFADGGLQHAGVTVLNGRPGHPFYGYPRRHTGYFCRTVLPHNCAAVTGACLMTPAAVFREVGGFDETFPLNYNDVDYCLRLRANGYRVVYTPHAELTHFEAVSKPGVFEEELKAFQARWGTGPDPYYNPNLNAETFDYRIRE